jgi:mRNA-degrading endonuclease RelE of RelBE toxin-antitoxin system
MAIAYVVQSTAAFERDARKLIKKNQRMGDVLEAIQSALQEDPFNLSRKHNIKKLTDVKDGEGRWRIRSGVYRLRYDVYGHTVVLHSINHRSQAY